MERVRDPYNRDELIDACAKHGWDSRKEEFLKRGWPSSEAELRQYIVRAIENPATQAFRCQPENEQDREKRGKPIPTRALGREVYDLRPLNEANKNYGITVVLNPNRDPDTGKIFGGTCAIRRDDALFARELKDEVDRTGTHRDQLLEKMGGRPALREQEQHRQLVVVSPPREQERQPPAELENRNRIVAEIWNAYGRSQTPQAFMSALEEKGMRLAVVTKEEAERSRTGAAAAAREQGRNAPIYREGEIVVVTERGGVYQLNQRTTGEKSAQVEKFLAPLDRSTWKGIDATRQIMLDRAAVFARGIGRGLMALGSLVHTLADAFISLLAPAAPKTAAQIEKDIQRAEQVIEGIESDRAKFRYDTNFEGIKKRHTEEQAQTQKERDDYRKRQQGQER